MSKFRIIGVLSVFILLILAAIIFFEKSGSRQRPAENSILAASHAQESSYDITAKRDLLALMMAYPEYIKGLEKKDNNTIYVIMRSGSRIIYDDMKLKHYEDKLANADLQDMMEQVYPLSDIRTIMEDCIDPGRIRVYRFFNEVYGSSQGKIEANLSTVSLGSKNFSFNQNNDAAFALGAVFQELSDLAKRNPDIYSFVYPVNGTYNYRNIAGTSQLSPHSFGIAIDLKSDKRDYWRWATKKQGQSRLDSYPRELVRIFENNYFIWGGKWAHFDFLHFEYRPELIIKSKYYIEPDKMMEPWYAGFPDTEFTQNFIDMIERALR